MYRLKASENAGMTYYLHATAVTIEQFKDEMARLDKLKLRWFIEDHAGVQQVAYPCAVHRAILRNLRAVAPNGTLLSSPQPPILGRKK